jgi:excinuclease ABC subunit C
VRGVGRRPAAIALLPEEPGVYRFRSGTDVVLYVGRAVNLRRRVASYWGDLADRRRLARMVPRIARIEALVCDSEHEAAWAERNLLEQHLPRWNLAPGGQESPVYIQLDRSPSSPGLDVVYQQARGAQVRLFGPYLGGHRARLAVSALRRVHPLDSCGTKLDAAERDLAQCRLGPAAGPPQLPDLVAAVTAVLDRAPGPVAAALTELAARRDAATATQAFELAGRIQEEVAALAWVVAPQRVTRDGGSDADPCAWIDGTMVRLAVRAGRLCEWSQEATAEPGTGVRGMCGLNGWGPFLRRNAVLAAALARVPLVP